MDIQTKIISEYAIAECDRISTSTIRTLQKMQQVIMLSGDDSVLRNYWDEICVQIQNEESFYWDAYVFTIKQIIDPKVNELSPNARMAIWLQTEKGYQWDETEDAPDIVGDVVHHIMHKYLFAKAETWTNWRIEYFLASQHDVPISR